MSTDKQTYGPEAIVLIYVRGGVPEPGNYEVRYYKGEAVTEENLDRNLTVRFTVGGTPSEKPPVWR